MRGQSRRAATAWTWTHLDVLPGKRGACLSAARPRVGRRLVLLREDQGALRCRDSIWRVLRDGARPCDGRAQHGTGRHHRVHAARASATAGGARNGGTHKWNRVYASCAVIGWPVNNSSAASFCAVVNTRTASGQASTHLVARDRGEARDAWPRRERAVAGGGHMERGTHLPARR